MSDGIEEPDVPGLLDAMRLAGGYPRAPDVITGSAGEKSTPRATSYAIGDVERPR